jgi:hypothetical protein
MKRSGKNLKKNPPIPALLAALLAASLSATGCSWIFMERPPKDPETERLFDCSGPGWPVIDTLFALGSLVYAGIQLHGNANFDPDEHTLFTSSSKTTLLAMGLINLAFALIHGASAGTGFYWSNECREAQRTRDHWLKTRRSATEMKRLETSIEKARKEPRERPGNRSKTSRKPCSKGGCCFTCKTC